jgi:hypothetical protein
MSYCSSEWGNKHVTKEQNVLIREGTTLHRAGSECSKFLHAINQGYLFSSFACSLLGVGLVHFVNRPYQQRATSEAYYGHVYLFIGVGRNFLI